MKRLLTMALCGTLLAGCSYFGNEGELIDYADPTIIVANGKYYMTGTSGSDGFTMLESDTLQTNSLYPEERRRHLRDAQFLGTPNSALQ